MSAQRAVAYFVAQGWTPAQAAGIAANLQAESNFRRDAVGDGGLAYGIAQWHPPRQRDFERVFGKSIVGTTLDEQLAFVHWELTNTEKRAGDALRACITALEAGACVSRLYERPRDADVEAAKRAALAAKIAAETPPTLEREPRPDVPADTPLPSPSKPTEPRMGALAALQLFAPILSGLIPQIASILKPESDTAKRNVALAETLVNTITQTAQAPNLQAAVEKMQAQPEVKAAVQKAVVTEPTVMATLQIVEVGGGIVGARQADLAVMQSDKPFWKTSAVFWISILLLPMVLWYVGSSIVGGVDIPSDWPWYAQFPLKLFGVGWSLDARSGLANLVVGLVLGGICGVYFGVSVTQAKAAANAASNKEA